MLTNSELLVQTNELAKRFAAMSGLYIKTPNPDFRNINTPACQKFWAMACLAQEMLTGANPNICNNNVRTKKNVRTATEVTGDDLDIKREFERIERNQQIIDLTDKLEALDYLKAKQAKTPSVGADGV